MPQCNILQQICSVILMLCLDYVIPRELLKMETRLNEVELLEYGNRWLLNLKPE